MKKHLQHKILLVLIILLPASAFSQLLFTENFSSGSLPVGWTNDSLGYPASLLWIFNNQYARQISGAGFDANFAIFDSDAGNVNDSLDENASLTTPDIDISSAVGTLFFDVDQQYRPITGAMGGTRVLKYSVNSGVSWTILDSTQNGIGYPNPAVHTIYDLSSVLPASTLMIRFQYYGSWDWWWAIDNLELTSQQQCTTAPNAGSAQSSMTVVCPLDTFNLSLVGEDQLIGLTFQWQSSPDTINWTDISGDTLETARHYQTTATYYRCAISCIAQTSYSNSILVNMNLAMNCYCSGTFTTGCDILDKVVFNTLSNINSGCNGNPDNYINYPDTGMATTNVVADSTYDLVIASGVGFGNHGAGVWFDFNHDGDFQDAGEFFHISDSIPESSGDFITSITLPSTSQGTTRMKVRYVYNNPVTQSSDCFVYGYGETEDYTIYIFNPTINVENLVAENINIYPSPATNQIKISTGQLKGLKKLSMYDQTGRLCYASQNNSSYSEINVSDFSRGIYFLKVETDKGAIAKKIVLN